MSENKRGSEVLLEKLGHHKGISLQTLEKFVKIVQSHAGSKFVHILDHGQPVPDILFGAIHTTPEASANLLRDLILFEDLRFDLNILINGIPFPDLIRIEFKTPMPGR